MIFLYFILLVYYLNITLALKIAVVGSGPSGLLFSSKILSGNNLVKEIDIYDYRDDPRNTFDHRSYAIGVNTRTVGYLKECHNDLPEFLTNNSFSTINKVTLTRDKKKTVSLNPFVKLMTTQPLITRGLLSWLSKLSQHSQCKFITHFKTRVINVDSLNGLLYTMTDDKVETILCKQYDLIVGADGAKSMVRQSILQQPNITFEGFYTNARWKFISLQLNDKKGVNESSFYSYKGTQGGWWYMPNNRIHLVTFWRTKSIDEITNPSCIKSPEDAKLFLQSLFDYEIPNIDKVSSEFYGTLSTGESIFKLSKYHRQFGKAVLIGDAAHVMSSALGQGMTCAFGDALSLYNNLDKHSWKNIPDALEDYSNERVQEGLAITDLNFIAANKKYFLLLYFIQLLCQKFIPKYELLIQQVNNMKYKYSDIIKKYKFWVSKGLEFIRLELQKRNFNL